MSKDPEHDDQHPSVSPSTPPSIEEITQQSETLQRLAAIGELAAGIVHQARNRMTGALTFAQVGKRRTAEEDKAHQLFEHIETELIACMDSFESLLRAAREREKLGNVLAPLAEARAPVDEILEGATRLTQSHLRMNKLTLEVESEEGLPPVRATQDVVIQTLLNLILNAEHASKPGTTISLHAQRAGDQVEITVSDQGSGVQERLRERIFEPFFTTKEDGVGTGLGLSTSRRHMRALGGELSLRDKADPGACFVVSLPTAEEGATS